MLWLTLTSGALDARRARQTGGPDMLYVGVDLHRRTSQLVALDEGGQVTFKRNVASERTAIMEALGRLQGPTEVVFEATWGWGWLADLLVEMGIPAHMAHPLQTRAIATARVKNDAIDARTLAHLLRTNLLPEAWIAPPEVREGRRLVRLRAGPVRIRTRIKQQAHAVLGEHGMRVTASDMFGVRGLREVETLDLPQGA